MYCLQHPGVHYREKEYFKVTQLLHQRLRSAQLVNQGTTAELQKIQPKNQYNVQGEKLGCKARCLSDTDWLLAGAQCKRQVWYSRSPALP